MNNQSAAEKRQAISPVEMMLRTNYDILKLLYDEYGSKSIPIALFEFFKFDFNLFTSRKPIAGQLGYTVYSISYIRNYSHNTIRVFMSN